MIKPTQDFVLVKRKEEEIKTNGGILLPEQKAGKYDVLEGTVIVTGPGRRLPDGKNILKVQVNKGDKILYKQYAGHHLTINKKDYWLINERDILAIITDYTN
jgi:chaperonin GroES